MITNIICVIYRPSGNNIDSFMIWFDAILSNLSKTKTDCLIAGDYNIDLLQSDTD